MKNGLYTCTYTTGSGEEYNDGSWELKITPKTMTLEKKFEFMGGIYAMHEIGEKFKIGKGTGNPVKDIGENDFIVYFRQGGTPYYFEIV